MRNAHQDLKYGEKNENHGKWEIHTSGREMWRGKQNWWKIQKCPLQDMEYGKKTENHGK